MRLMGKHLTLLLIQSLSLLLSPGSPFHSCPCWLFLHISQNVSFKVPSGMWLSIQGCDWPAFPAFSPFFSLPFRTQTPPSLAAAGTLSLAPPAPALTLNCAVPFKALLPSTPSAHVGKETRLYLSSLQHGSSQFVLHCPLCDSIHYWSLLHTWRSEAALRSWSLWTPGMELSCQAEPALQPLLCLLCCGSERHPATSSAAFPSHAMLLLDPHSHLAYHPHCPRPH